MSDVTKRPNYFDRQFLRKDDFTDEQDYHIDRRRRHNRLLHTPGVAEGLIVTGNPGDNFVTVSAGTAYDALGEEIVLAGSQQVSIATVSGTQALITAAYFEQPTDPTADPGVTGNSTRITEQPALSVSAPPALGNSLVLASVTIVNGAIDGTVANNPDNSVRVNAAVVIGDQATVSKITFKNAAAPPAEWPTLGGQANDLALQNGRLTLDSGREVFFQDQGQVRCFDDNHRITFNRNNNLLELCDLGYISLQTGGPSPTEKLRVTAGGQVGIGTATPHSILEVQSSAPEPAVTMTNSTGGTGAQASLDFNTSPPPSTGAYNPTSRIGAVETGAGANDIVFSSNKPGAANNGLAEVLRVTSDAHIHSPMWNVTQVIAPRSGPIPINAQFSSGGGLLLIFASGSGISNTSDAIGMEIFIDSTNCGAAISFGGDTPTHVSFAANALVVAGIAAGEHTFMLQPIGVVTETADIFSATVLELPIK